MQTMTKLSLGATGLLLLLACGKQEGEPSWLLIDTDRDGLIDRYDNCPEVANLDQADSDLDGLGDACDGGTDTDSDGIPDEADNCQLLSNPDQTDGDGDGVGDRCDNCPDDPNPDQLDHDANGVGNACICDGCLATELCRTHPLELAECIDPGTCQDHETCSDTCCGMGSTCDTNSDTCVLPDLVPDTAAITESLEFVTETIAADDCQVVQGCVESAGNRDLMKFDIRIRNDGTGDLDFGDIQDAGIIANFVLDECTQTGAYTEFIELVLKDASGIPRAERAYQGYCLIDDTGTGEAAYSDCLLMGLQAGWSALAPKELPCNGLDVTGLAPGDYTLEIALDPGRNIAEADYDNNVTTVAITIPEPDPEP